MKARAFQILSIMSLVLLTTSATPATRDQNTRDPIKDQEVATLAFAPDVPPPITRNYATKVIVHLEVREMEGRLADGVMFTFWTFGGKVPGKFIRIREGDLSSFISTTTPTTRCLTISIYTRSTVRAVAPPPR
jgi:nitrite reductase (NO-forming)